MASIYFYQLNNEIKIDELEFINENGLNINEIKKYMDTNLAGYKENGIFCRSGFNNTEILNENVLKTTYIFENNLGNYTEILYDKNNNKIESSIKNYTYYGLAQIIISREGNMIIATESSKEEGVKGLFIELMKNIGIEFNKVKYDGYMIKYIKNNYIWTKIKIDQIEENKDSTTNILYQIDPASENQSMVDKLYEGRGRHSYIKFEIPYKNDIFTVNLYTKGNKISLNTNDFINNEDEENFYLYLFDKIIEIKKKSLEI